MKLPMNLDRCSCSFFPLGAKLFLLFTLQLPLFYQVCHGQFVDSLPLGSILHAPNQTLLSKSNTFALGFFSTGPDLNYVGIYFYRIDNKTRIWMANRNAPAKDGASLMLSKDGNLIISNPDQTTVWMSSTGGLNITSMAMEETGNFVLQNVDGKVVWQSFDHPADTWIPGMRMYLGWNLTSSISMVNVAEGRFSMLMLQTTAFISEWNATTQYWSSGIWDGSGFEWVPEMSENYAYTFQLKNDSRGPYFAWQEKQGLNLYSHFTLEYDGNIRVHTWDRIDNKWYTVFTQPKEPCLVDHLCGQNGLCNEYTTPFCSCPQGFKPVDPAGWSNGDWSLGCAAIAPVNCSSAFFLPLNNTSYDQGSGGGKSYSGKDQGWCQAQCTSDCACLGFSYDETTANCSLQHGPFVNGKTASSIAQTFFLRQQHFLSSRGGNNSRVWIIGVSVGAGCAVFLVVAFILWLIICKRQVAFHGPFSSKYISGILKKYSYRELQSATNKFSEKLGAGGFGSVFKGRLPDKTLIAVKKLHRMKQGEKDFRIEVSTLGMIQHVNLVRLRGFCAEGDQRLLVYDYMPNGSLESLLFSKRQAQRKAALDWDTRFAIAVGTAKGITYLHEECRDCIIHCDIKPDNILLDSDHRAKVSDLGLAKLMGREFSHVITSMRGTRGYLAPEWLSGLPITAKADVYSYGMTLFEIISGRRNVESNSSLEKWFFPSWACQRAEVGDFSSLADARLEGKFNVDEVKRAVLVALWCIQDDESSRPSMGKVVQMLEGTIEIADPPSPRSLQMLELERNYLSKEVSLSLSGSLPKFESSR